MYVNLRVEQKSDPKKMSYSLLSKVQFNQDYKNNFHSKFKIIYILRKL